jgi:hypothetical protein
MGKQAKFFDISKPSMIKLGDYDAVMTYPGFKASAFCYQSNFAIVIDNVNKFMSKKSCLQRIEEINEQYHSSERKQRIIDEFKGSSVIGDWGHKRAYKILDIAFDKTPGTHKFTSVHGDTMSVAEYFLKAYDLKIKNLD